MDQQLTTLKYDELNDSGNLIKPKKVYGLMAFKGYRIFCDNIHRIDNTNIRLCYDGIVIEGNNIFRTIENILIKCALTKPCFRRFIIYENKNHYRENLKPKNIRGDINSYSHTYISIKNYRMVAHGGCPKFKEMILKELKCVNDYVCYTNFLMNGSYNDVKKEYHKIFGKNLDISLISCLNGPQYTMRNMLLCQKLKSLTTATCNN